MKNIFLAITLLLTASVSQAQKTVTLNINHKLGNGSFAFNQAAQNDLSQEFQVTRIDYYISGITLIHDGGMNTPVPDKYILAKGSSNVSEQLGTFNVTNIEGIKFSIGVDAPTNNADPSLQPAGAPLSFQTPSMHWGWSAGYRFVALEGKFGNGFGTTFELHGLWNENYFQQTVMAEGVNSGNNVAINLDADYTQALKGIDISSGPIEHGTNGNDLTVLKNFRDYVFKPGSGTTSLSEIVQDESIRVYPNPAKGVVYVDASGSQNKISRYVLTDISGKVMEEKQLDKSGAIRLEQAGGIYFLVLFNGHTPVLSRKILLQ